MGNQNSQYPFNTNSLVFVYDCELTQTVVQGYNTVIWTYI